MDSRVSIYSREFTAAVERADTAEFTLAEVRRLAQVVPSSTAMQTTDEERKYWSYDPEVRPLTKDLQALLEENKKLRILLDAIRARVGP